jgi:hypothetical protein
MQGPSLPEATRAAVAIAVFPPRFRPVGVAGPDAAELEREVFRALTASIQRELERRRFEVAWVRETPDSAAAMRDVAARFPGVFQLLREAYARPGAGGARPPAFSASVGDVRPVLETWASDLLLLVDAGGGPDTVGVQVALVDASGEVIFYSAAEEKGAYAFDPGVAAATAKKALARLPGR